MWNELTVGQYIKLLDIEQNDNLNIVERQQKMVAVLNNQEEEAYDNIKYRDLVEQYKSKTAFLSEMPITKPVDYLKTGTRTYKFCFELNEMTSGQYIDTMSFGTNLLELHKIAASFFLPMEGDKYMPYGHIPHDIVADDLLDAKFVEVHGCFVFFYQLLMELIKDTETYSKLTEEAKESLTRLWNNGVGYIPLRK